MAREIDSILDFKLSNANPDILLYEISFSSMEIVSFSLMISSIISCLFILSPSPLGHFAVQLEYTVNHTSPDTKPIRSGFLDFLLRLFVL